MTHLIDKNALVALIESYKDNFCDRNGYLEDSETNGLAYDTLCDLEDSIDTLEVKEVDLEKHLKEDIEDIFFDLDGIAVEDVKDIARHFFELGLKAKGE
jgi:hypothetical protein